jgi:hypothetical protein
MTVTQFKDLVRQMRKAQQQYYATARDNSQKNSLLVLSKQLEKEVDQELKKDVEPKLF